MEKAKVIRRVNNLDKIRGIVEIAKFDTLQKLATTNKIRDHHYKMADASKEVLSFARSKYNLSTQLSNKIKNKLELKTLWVFLTISSKLIKTSYTHFEHIIINEFDNDKDQIIVIGEPAINFANKNSMRTLMIFKDNKSAAPQVSSIINEVINNNLFDKVNIVSNTPKIRDKPYTVYPIPLNKKDNRKMRKIKFYYSLPNILNNITESYVSNTIEGIFQESRRFFYQEKLIKHEGSLKSIDERIFGLKSSLNKLMRKNETEEIIQVTQISKRK